MDPKDIANLSAVSRAYKHTLGEHHWLKKLQEIYPDEKLRGDDKMSILERYNLSLKIIPLEKKFLSELYKIWNVSEEGTFYNESEAERLTEIYLKNILPYNSEFIKKIVSIYPADRQYTEMLVKAVLKYGSTDTVKNFMTLSPGYMYNPILMGILLRDDYDSLRDFLPVKPKVYIVNMMKHIAESPNIKDKKPVIYRRLLDLYSKHKGSLPGKKYFGKRQPDSLLYNIIFTEYPQYIDELLRS